MHTAELGSALVILLGGWLLVSAAVEPSQQPRLAALALFSGALSGIALLLNLLVQDTARASALLGMVAEQVLRLHAAPRSEVLVLMLVTVGSTWIASAALVPQLSLGACALLALLNGGVVSPLVWRGLHDQGLPHLLPAFDGHWWWIDLPPLGLGGLIGGVAALAWLMRVPRRAASAEPPRLPLAHVPWQGVTGIMLLALGFSMREGAAALAQFSSFGLGMLVAVLVAGGYTAFVARMPDVLSMARAALANAFFFLNAPELEQSALAIPALIGIGSGFLATLGYYLVCERWRYADAHGMLVSVLVPAGASAAWRAVAAGALHDSVPEASSVLVLQAAGLMWIFAVPFGVHLAAASWMRGRMRKADSAPQAAPAASQEERTLWVEEPVDQAPSSEAVAVVPAANEPEVAPPAATASALHTAADAHQAATLPSPSSAEQDLLEESKVAASADQPVPSSLGHQRWWQFWRQPKDGAQSAPKRPARKVAYPRRVAGRPLAVHPVAAKNPAPASDESTEGRVTQ